jgi:hypothetical protein
MEARLTNRRLELASQLVVHVFADMAIAEFDWDFLAHYSGPPKIGASEGF